MTHPEKKRFVFQCAFELKNRFPVFREFFPVWPDSAPVSSYNAKVDGKKLPEGPDGQIPKKRQQSLPAILPHIPFHTGITLCRADVVHRYFFYSMAIG